MSRLRLAKNAQEAHAGVRVDALLLGRAVDASVRGDSDWFLHDYPAHANPVLAVAASLAELLRSIGDAFQPMLARFETVDPVEISVGLEGLHHLLAGEESDQETVLKAVALASELSASLRQDPGLTHGGACRVLTYAALEAYYYARATAKAKRRFDADRGLIRCATGLVESAINQDEDLGIGLSVWEGWQAIRSLRSFFALAELAAELERRRNLVLAGVLFTADVILRMSERPVDVDAVMRSIAAVERLAEKDRRKEDLVHTKALRSELEEVAKNQEVDEQTAAVAPAEQHERSPLDRTLEPAFLPRTDHDEVVPPRPREPAALIEDLSSVVERLEILLDGDDNSLVFEVAPILLRSLRSLYAELSAHHPSLRDSIYSNEGGLQEPGREVQALRALVQKGAALVEHHDGLRAALRVGELAVGYPTDEAGAFDDVTDPDPPRDPLEGVRLIGAGVRRVELDPQALVLHLDVRFEDGEEHPIRLVLEDPTRIDWHRVNLACGMDSLGRIDRFERDAARVRIAGAWGDVEVIGAELRIAIE